jgi:hypothetical protein
MKKINELVTKTEKPEHKSKRRAVTFGSFKRAEEKQIQERKDREHQEELDRIAEDARIQRAISDEETRVIKEENTRKRNDTITKKLSNAFGTKTELDYKPVREQVIDKYLPQLREQESLDDHPKPFVAEPALNAELAEFKKKINEHLHKVGFASSSGGGAGSFADLDDVDPSTAKVNGKFLKYDSSSAKFVGADSSGGSAADDISAGDSAINLTTTSGDITIDAAANNSDIILKGTDGSADTTFLTIDGSSAGKATFNNEIVSGAVITSGAGLVIADAGNIGSASDTDAIAIASDGKVTFTQEVIAPSLDISGDVDVDGTLETDALTIGGTTLAETIADTVGAMVTSNTETGIAVTYEDGDNTLDFVIGTLNQDTTGNAATATALETARTIGGTSFDGTANIAVALAATATALASARTIGGVSFDGTGNINLPGVNAAGNQDTSGTAAIATTVTITDNESTNEDNAIIFGAGGDVDGGNLGLESDGTLTYNPSTGKVTATGFVGTLTGDVTGNTSGTAATVTGAAQSSITSVGTLTSIVIADAGNIGSASDTDAIAIAANGVVTFSQVPVFPNDTVETADIQADAITGAKIADDAINSEHYTDGSIDTAHIADANVTLAKIANAAANTVIVRDANSSGVLSAKAVTNTQILIGDGTGFTAAALSGDVTMTNAGAVTIANTSVTNGMLAGSIANSKLSNSSITVSDGSTTTAVSLGGTITFSGTSNEVTVGENSGTITVGLPNDVTIAGDLTINGDTTTVNTATLSVEDPLIILANGNNSADSVDIGFYGLYDTSGSQDLYAGLFRDANDSGKFKLFKDLQAAPTTTVNVSGTGYAVGTLVANIEGNVTGNTSGTAATVTTAAQSNITSLGTLTTLTVDNIIINGTNIGHTSDTDAIAIASDGVVNFTQAPTVASVAIKTAGKETIYVPASAMYPTTTNGCAALAQVETTAQQPEFKVLDFDKDATEYAQFTVAFPKSWNASTITFRAFWIGVASTDGVAWALQGRSVADNAESVGAFGTAVVVQDDSQNDATETLISAESSDVTIAGVADDTLTYFQIYRDHDDANDDMAGDARLLGIQLFYTTDAANDA